MKKIIVVGSGGHAKACIDVIEKQKKFKILGIIENIKSKKKNFMGYPVLGNDKNLKEIKKKCSNALIGVGQIKNPELRSTIYNKLKNLGFILPIIISPNAYVSNNSKIGSGSIIMHKAVISAGSKVGINCIINTKALLEHDVEIGNDSHISTGVIINGNTKVGCKTFIGSGSIIKQKINVGKNCIIGMGKIIKKNIKDFKILK